MSLIAMRYLHNKGLFNLILIQIPTIPSCKSVRFKPKLIRPFSPVTPNEAEATAWLFVNKYLFASPTDIIIHDPAQMAVVSKQMCNTVILAGTLRLITQSD